MATDPELRALDRPGTDSVAAPSPRGGYGAQVDESDIVREFVPVVKRLALRLKGRMA